MSYDWHTEVEEDEDGTLTSIFLWGEDYWLDEDDGSVGAVPAGAIPVEVEIQVYDGLDATMYIYPADDDALWPNIENPLGSLDPDGAIRETEQILQSLPEFHHDVAW